MNICRKGLYAKRFQYWPPWECTFWYRPHFERGSDEYHNTSWLCGLGPLGTFVFFKPLGKMRDENSAPCEECVKSDDWELCTPPYKYEDADDRSIN